MSLLLRATRHWSTAFHAARVEASVCRIAAGDEIDNEDVERSVLLADFFQSALAGFYWTKALIEDRAPPPHEPKNLDDFRFAVRVLPETVRDPEQALLERQDLCLSFAHRVADESMLEPMEQLAQRLRKLATSAVVELRVGLC